MDEPIYHVSFDLKIYVDECPESPREWDNLGTMVCSHKGYTLGDKQADNMQWYESWDEWFEHELSNANVISLPLYLYDHSGITMRTHPFSCRWDSGQVGYIYITKEKIRKEFGWKRISEQRYKQILEYLRDEVETYDHWLRGDVYGFVFDNSEGDDDSCSGFYGTDFKNNGMADHLPDEALPLLDLIT